MLETLSRWLIQRPDHILAIAAANLVLWALCRASVLRYAPKSNVFWISALVWLAYAAWEWCVLIRSPDADIRVDLLLIWPIGGLVTLWACLLAGRGWWSKSRQRN